MKISADTNNLISIYPIENWSSALWFKLTFFILLVLSVTVGVVSDAPLTYILGQTLLSFSAFISLCILSDRPLLNPIQAFVAIFYWWFGVAPTVGGGFHLLLNSPEMALMAQTSGMESLWIVASGLPLYSIVARHTLSIISQKNIYAHFLLPEGVYFKKNTILYLFSCGFISQIVMMLLSYLGVVGQESVNYLGGTKTTIWWVGIIVGISAINSLTTSALVTELLQPWKTIDPTIRIACIITISMTIYGAFTSGWKGQFVFLFFYILCAYISKHQRLPWRNLIIFLFLYLFFIEPFVASGRYLAELYDVTTSTEREALFKNLIGSGSITDKKTLNDINIESPFRGIYPLAGDITRNNDLFTGEWNGYSIGWGLGSLVPRVLNPDKKDMNIGNFFYKSTYSRTFKEDVVSDINNVAISLPFEFAGNYGLVVGVLSFMFIGVFWASFCGWLLSVPRLSNHPLTPFAISLTLGMEAAFGHFLANLRSLLIPFSVIFILRRFLKSGL